MMKLIFYCNKIIEYFFYALFFLVPLVFWGSTSELFEFNKMWLTYGLAIVILLAWAIKMVLQKRFYIQKTPLDIFIILFLISQIISTIFSLDQHISYWGYYSRFNGGLLSTFIYFALYYAFCTHFNPKHVLKLLKIILISSLIVILWGLPSHFGFDPTCLLFRGELNVACWTDAFKPTIRIFSTLGQPAWLAAFLAAVLPISMSFSMLSLTKYNHRILAVQKNVPILYYILLTTMLYLGLLFTNTRAGFFGFWAANLIFWVIVFIKKLYPLKTILSFFLIFNSIFFSLNFIFETPLAQLNKITYRSLFLKADKKVVTDTPQNTNDNPTTPNDITDSGKIRLYVWEGAIDAWKAYPVFGTGVETFALAYYRFRPMNHNLTSEWDYLYNKAHNEYLNYLTTTGLFGLGTYLLIIGIFCYQIIKLLHRYMVTWLKNENTAAKQPVRDASQYTAGRFNNEDTILKSQLITIGLFTGWISILITNFFGFSVVIINLFLFLIPAFVFVLNDMLHVNSLLSYPFSLNNPPANARLPQPGTGGQASEALRADQLTRPALTVKRGEQPVNHVTVSQWLAITFMLLITCYMLLTLFRYWQADRAYGLGFNLNRSNYLQEAYTSLENAVKLRPNEPVFRDELSVSSFQLALALFQQNDATMAAQFAQQAIEMNTELLANHPNYLPFWKSRIRLFYSLGELDTRYREVALQAAQQAASLAPTDAKIWYNLGVLYGQTGKTDQGINTLNKTLELKSDYQDAYIALSVLYHEKAVDNDGKIVNEQMNRNARKVLDELLKINPDHPQAKQSLKEWFNK